MTSENENSTCTQYRAQCQPDGKLADEASAPIQAHGQSCPSCQKWGQQMQDLTSLTNALPQFDVPEALTQRILQAVDSEAKASHQWHTPAVMTATASLLAALCLVAPFESLESLAAWAVGLAGIFALQLLVTNAQALEPNT